MVYAVSINQNNFAPAKFTSISSLVNVVIPNLILVAGIALFFMLVYGGFAYMQSGGSPEKLKKAHGIITFALIGFGLVIASFILVKLIASILSVNNFFL